MRAAALSLSSVAMVAAVATCLHTTTKAFVLQNTNKIDNNNLPCCRYITSSSSSSSLLFAKKKKSNAGKGFGPSPKKGPKKYTMEDKSYGIISPTTSNNSNSGGSNIVEQSMEEIESSMNDFFNTYNEWKPLFRNILLDEREDSSLPPPMATSYLLSNNDNTPQQEEDDEEIWGISTLENRNPWRLLPSKPTTNSSLTVLSSFLDELQQSLLDIPLDTIISGVNDLHFLEEGRRTIAVTRFHVLDEYTTSDVNNKNEKDGDDGGGGYYDTNDWETELFRTCWSELAHLMSQDVNDTGSLILLPTDAINNSLGGDDEEEEEGRKQLIGLDNVRQFVDMKLKQPISWLGREDDWEIVALERGSLAVRLLYKLSDIPDLSERDSSGDENIKF